jgi:hypothetical protein
MKNFRQQLLFVLAPKNEYRPNIDSAKNSKALRGNAKKTIEWDSNQFSLVKSVSLRIDSIYLVILRVFGEMKDSTGTKGEAKRYVTLDCVQSFGTQDVLSTKSWRCLDGERIAAKHVCDAKAQCDDSSDELPSLCEGERTEVFQNLKHFITAILLIGFASFLFKQCLTSLPSIKLTEPMLSNNHDVTEEMKEFFPVIRRACTDLDIVNGTEKKIKSQHLEDLKDIYKAYHGKSSAHQMIILSAIKDFAKEPIYEEQCSILTDALLTLEQELHEDDQRRPNCLETALRTDLETASYVLATIDRHSFFSRLKLLLISAPKYVFGDSFSSVVFHCMVLLTTLFALKTVFVSYLDVVLDTNIYFSIQHVIENFLGDEDKAVLFSNLPFQAISYAYIISGFASQTGFFVVYVIHFRKLFDFEKTWVRYVIFCLSIFFPVHFIVLEVARYLIMHLKFSNDLRVWLKQLNGKDTDTEEDAETFVQYRSNSKKVMDKLVTIRLALVHILVVESVLENLPQIIITVTFMVSELETGHGKLLSILSNVIVNKLGGSFTFMCILMIFININKFTYGLITIRTRHQFPLENGIGGTVILLVSMGIMMWSKIALLATMFSHALSLYPVFMLVEIAIALIYFKATGISLNLMDGILPVWISPSLLLMSKEEYKSSISSKKMEVITTSIIHILNLVVGYTPLFLVTQFTEYMKSFRSSNLMVDHGKSVVAYTVAIVLYVLLSFVYEKFGNPWRHLTAIPSSNTDIITMGEIQCPSTDKEEEETFLSGVLEPPAVIDSRRVDPVTNQSFMVTNSKQVKNKLLERRKP